MYRTTWYPDRDGQPPDYPFTEIPSPPEGYTWDDIAYAIGGYNWKAHFIIEAKRTLCLPAIELARWLSNYMDKTLVCKDADWMAL